VSGDEDLLSGRNGGDDIGFVVREDTLGSELERLSSGRRNVVRTTPDVNLLVSPLLASCKRLQEARQFLSRRSRKI